jgi:hypothetical protein
MRLKGLFIACLLVVSSAIMAGEGVVKVINPNHATVVVIDSGNGNIVPGETIRMLNRPAGLKINDVLIVNFVEVGPPNNRETVGIIICIQH